MASAAPRPELDLPQALLPAVAPQVLDVQYVEAAMPLRTALMLPTMVKVKVARATEKARVKEAFGLFGSADLEARAKAKENLRKAKGKERGDTSV